MRKIQWLFGAALLAVLAACSQTPQDLGLTPQTDPSVPFRASVSGTLALTSETTFELAGGGDRLIATHLGRIDYAANGTFTGPATDVLIETLVAANGDTITIRCEQVLEEIAPGVFRGTDLWVVIGGTGRFQGASGSGSGETIADLNTNTFTKELSGDIAY